MYVCLHDVATDTWQLHAYGQHIVRHYGGDALVWSMREAQPPNRTAPSLPPPMSVLRRMGAGARAAEAAAAKATQAKAAGQGEELELRVVFQKRGGDPRQLTDRQLVNAAELVAACNRWRFTAPSGVRVRALCWEVEINSLDVSIAAAQQADVFVGAHGANIANGWLMRPGSAVVELTMHRFEESKPHLNLAKRNFEVRAGRGHVEGGVLRCRCAAAPPAADTRSPRPVPPSARRTWRARCSSTSCCCATRSRGRPAGTKRRSASAARRGTPPGPSTATSLCGAWPAPPGGLDMARMRACRGLV